MLAPKRVKFRKTFKGRTKGIATRGNTVAFGEWGLMSLEPGWITNRQIEAARVAMTREMKRGGKVWIRIFPDKPITKKPAETRMGKGKGNPEGWVAVVQAGAGAVRGRRHRGAAGAEGAGAGRGQAAGEDARSCGARRSEHGDRAICGSCRSSSSRPSWPSCRRSASRCGSARRPSRSRTRCSSGRCGGTSRGS